MRLDANTKSGLVLLLVAAASLAIAAQAQGDSHSLRPETPPANTTIEADPAYGEYLAGDCTSCHRIDGNDEGIPSITGWPQETFIAAMNAYKNKSRPHQIMQLMATRLADEDIAALAAYFGQLP